ncbi:MAG: hypothetical protein ACON46_05480 [Coraliomargaritaceae bacterium]
MPSEEFAFSVIYLNYERGEALKKRVPGINLKFRTDEKIYHLSAAEESISRTFIYRGSDPLVFYREVTSPEGEEIYQPLVSAQLGQPGRKLIVIVRNEVGALQAFTFSMNKDIFLPGTVRLLNFSKQLVRAKIAENTAEVRSMGIHDFQVEGESRKFIVSLILAADDGEEIYLIEKRRFAVSKNGRKLLFIYPDSKKLDRVTYGSYRFGSLPKGGNFSDAVMDIVDFEAQRLEEWRNARQGEGSPDGE